MGPQTRKRKTRRRRNWNTELGFIFFSMLFLTLAVERKNIVTADSDDMQHEKMEFSNPVTSNISILLANITGKL